MNSNPKLRLRSIKIISTILMLIFLSLSLNGQIKLSTLVKLASDDSAFQENFLTENNYEFFKSHPIVADFSILQYVKPFKNNAGQITKTNEIWLFPNRKMMSMSTDKIEAFRLQKTTLLANGYKIISEEKSNELFPCLNDPNFLPIGEDSKNPSDQGLVVRYLLTNGCYFTHTTLKTPNGVILYSFFFVHPDCCKK